MYSYIKGIIVDLAKDYIVIDNSKINIQISVCDDVVIIGCPLINGSF